MEKFSYYMREIIHSVSEGLGNYLKATFKLAGIATIILAVGLWLVGVDFWFWKAIGIAFVDMIPILGSGIIMIPWALVHFFLGNTSWAWQIGLLYIVLVVFRQIAEPIITGRSIGVRPLYTFLSTIVCVLIFGPIGAVLGAVVAVVIKAITEVKAFEKKDYEI
ncbi:MAG TPA: AI-2E family transporter [Candidatus Jeotgalibaca pullicola]|nr:AI-2E family transporter [Candidatus Jeotgalibaca pullicola]